MFYFSTTTTTCNLHTKVTTNREECTYCRSQQIPCFLVRSLALNHLKYTGIVIPVRKWKGLGRVPPSLYFRLFHSASQPAKGLASVRRALLGYRRARRYCCRGGTLGTPRKAWSASRRGSSHEDSMPRWGVDSLVNGLLGEVGHTPGCGDLQAATDRLVAQPPPVSIVDPS